jgi:hypothetical protein
MAAEICNSTHFGKRASGCGQSANQGTRKHKLSHVIYFQLQSGMVLLPS